MSGPNPTIVPKNTGDPTKVSMRVQALRAVKQLEGHYQVLAEQPMVRGAALHPLLTPPAWTQSVTEGVLHVTGTFRFEGRVRKAGSEEMSLAIVISARFVAEYTIAEGDPLLSDDLEAFARVNGLFNLQAFWREFICSCCARAGFPPFMLPPYNPVKSGHIKMPATPTPAIKSV